MYSWCCNRLKTPSNDQPWLNAARTPAWLLYWDSDYAWLSLRTRPPLAHIGLRSPRANWMQISTGVVSPDLTILDSVLPRPVSLCASLWPVKSSIFSSIVKGFLPRILMLGASHPCAAHVADGAGWEAERGERAPACVVCCVGNWLVTWGMPAPERRQSASLSGHKTSSTRDNIRNQNCRRRIADISLRHFTNWVMQQNICVQWTLTLTILKTILITPP